MINGARVQTITLTSSCQLLHALLLVMLRKALSDDLSFSLMCFPSLGVTASNAFNNTLYYYLHFCYRIYHSIVVGHQVVKLAPVS